MPIYSTAYALHKLTSTLCVVHPVCLFVVSTGIHVGLKPRQQVAAQQACSVVVVKLLCWVLGSLGCATSLYDTTHQHCPLLPLCAER